MAEFIDLHGRSQWKNEPTKSLHIRYSALMAILPNDPEIRWMRAELHYRAYLERCGEQLQLPFDEVTPL